MMESETHPPASLPHEAGDPEVSSRRVYPDPARPEGNPLAAQGPQYPAPEESNRKSPAPSSVRSEALKDLLEQAAISEAHRALMGTLIERISSAESGLHEAVVSLLKGFEVAEGPVASRTDEFAELKRQLDAADADIVLVNKRLDEAQDGAAAVETLRAELAQAKEQARKSDAAAREAVEGLRAEQAAHRQSKEEIAKMAVELKDAADSYELLKNEDRAKMADLEKATTAAKDARSTIRAMKEELRHAGDIAAGKPFMLQMKFGDLQYAPLDRLWSSADAYIDLAASAADAAEYFKDQKDREVEKLF
ncbi:uncharacterized protein [Aegilops tauschii subsp. strangulata]|uniref:uncharacterized protein n=1 Tax=Aegilops tauschii subsp. strangulata TaxID=200361 RepID=UPI003CC8408E